MQSIEDAYFLQSSTRRMPNAPLDRVDEPALVPRRQPARRASASGPVRRWSRRSEVSHVTWPMYGEDRMRSMRSENGEVCRMGGFDLVGGYNGGRQWSTVSLDALVGCGHSGRLGPWDLVRVFSDRRDSRTTLESQRNAPIELARIPVATRWYPTFPTVRRSAARGRASVLQGKLQPACPSCQTPASKANTPVKSQCSRRRSHRHRECRRSAHNNEVGAAPRTRAGGLRDRVLGDERVRDAWRGRWMGRWRRSGGFGREGHGLPGELRTRAASLVARTTEGTIGVVDRGASLGSRSCRRRRARSCRAMMPSRGVGFSPIATRAGLIRWTTPHSRSSSPIRG